MHRAGDRAGYRPYSTAAARSYSTWPRSSRGSCGRCWTRPSASASRWSTASSARYRSTGLAELFLDVTRSEPSATAAHQARRQRRRQRRARSGRSASSGRRARSGLRRAGRGRAHAGPSALAVPAGQAHQPRSRRRCSSWRCRGSRSPSRPRRSGGSASSSIRGCAMPPRSSPRTGRSACRPSRRRRWCSAPLRRGTRAGGQLGVGVPGWRRSALAGADAAPARGSARSPATEDPRRATGTLTPSGPSWLTSSCRQAACGRRSSRAWTP